MQRIDHLNEISCVSIWKWFFRLKVQIFWEGQKAPTLFRRSLFFKVGDFFKNFVAFSQYLKFTTAIILHTAKKIITIMMMITISNIQTTFTELCIGRELFSHYTLQGRRNLGKGGPSQISADQLPLCQPVEID